MNKLLKVESLLNRIKEQNMEELIKEFISYDVSSDKQELEQIVAHIVYYAITKPGLSSIYAELCECQIKEELEKNQNSEGRFRHALLTEAQTHFHSILEPGEIDHLSQKPNDPYFLQFLANLFIKNIIPMDIFENFLSTLSRTVYYARKKEDVNQKNVLCAMILVNFAGEYIDKKSLDEWFRRMNLSRQFLADENRSALAVFVTLQKNGWIRSDLPDYHTILMKLYWKLYCGHEFQNFEELLGQLCLPLRIRDETLEFEWNDNLKDEKDYEASNVKRQKLEIDFEQFRKFTTDGIESLKTQMKSQSEIAELPKKRSDTEILEEYSQALKPDFKSKVSAMNQELARLAQNYPEFNQILKAKMEISEICENVDEYIEEARKGYERIMNFGGSQEGF